MPGGVADDGDLRESAAVAQVPAQVAQESAYRPAAESAHVEEQGDRQLPPRELGGEGGFEAAVVGGGEPSGCANAKDWDGGEGEGEHRD